MALAIIVTTDGDVKTTDFVVGNSYEMIRQGVGGYIECVALNNGIDMWVNEEGKLDGLPLNLTATVIFGGNFGLGRDIIMGDVVFTGGVDEEGETLGLTSAHLDYLRNYFDINHLAAAPRV